PYRNSVCSTFFCSNDHGGAGEGFWGALQDLVGRVETGLSQWAMTTLGLDAAAYHLRLDSLAADIDAAFEPTSGAWSAEARQHLWGSWCGRERQFIVATGELAMQQRAALYEIATQQQRHTALVFERAVRDWVPEAHRSEVPPVPDEPGDRNTVEALWYKV